MAVDDPRFEQFLRDYERDRSEGITLRGVHNRVQGLQRDFEKERRETRDRLKGLEGRSDALEKRQSTEDLADALRDANGTGPHPVMQITTPVAFPTPFAMPAPAPLPPPAATPKRESGFFGSLWRTLKRKLGIIAAGVVIAAAGHFEGTCSARSQGAQAAADRTSPATSSPPVVPLPFDPPTRPAVPSAMPDASRQR